MAKFLGIDFAKTIDAAFKPLRPPTCSIAQSVLPAIDESDPTATRTATVTTHTNVRCIVADYSDREIDGTTIIKGDRQVIIFAGSLPAGVVPGEGDRVTVESRTQRVLRVERDPAAATYTLQVR